MKIFLLGFMGCGKSYVGRRLAAKLNWSFIDLDDQIVALAGKTIPAIFATEGEASFRIWEQKALHQLEHLEQVTISLGGGTPCFFDNMVWINQQGISVFLNCSTPLLVQRLQHETESRPLLAGKNTTQLTSFIDGKVSERLPFYQQANIEYKMATGQEPIIEDLRTIFVDEWRLPSLPHSNNE